MNLVQWRKKNFFSIISLFDSMANYWFDLPKDFLSINRDELNWQTKDEERGKKSKLVQYLKRKISSMTFVSLLLENFIDWNISSIIESISFMIPQSTWECCKNRTNKKQLVFFFFCISYRWRIEDWKILHKSHFQAIKCINLTIDLISKVHRKIINKSYSSFTRSLFFYCNQVFINNICSIWKRLLSFDRYTSIYLLAIYV